jgi:hypothetical protein
VFLEVFASACRECEKNNVTDNVTAIVRQMTFTRQVPLSWRRRLLVWQISWHLPWKPSGPEPLIVA